MPSFGKDCFIVALCARKGSGKDTLADHLRSRYPCMKKRALADPLKEACGAIFGFEDDQLYGNLKESVDEFWKVTPRHVLQTVGTQLFRDRLGEHVPLVRDGSVWIRCLHRWILSTIEQNRKRYRNTLLVITDVRMENEAEWCYEHDIPIIGIERRGVSTDDQHESELQIDGITKSMVIQNNGTLEDFKESIDKEIGFTITEFIRSTLPLYRCT